MMVKRPRFQRKNKQIEEDRGEPVCSSPAAQKDKGEVHPQHNYFNPTVLTSGKEDEDKLIELLFTNQKGSCASTLKQPLSISRDIFLLNYSPDTAFRSPPDDSEILIDGYEDSCKRELSTNVPQTVLFSRQEPICSGFNLGESLPCSCLQVALLSVNSYSFKLSYSPNHKGRLELGKDAELLVNRMKKKFRKDVHLMFVLADTVKEFTVGKLRQFLVQQQIRFNTKQTDELGTILQGRTAEEMLETVFMTADDEEMLIVNLSQDPLRFQINLYQRNFWKGFELFFRTPQTNSQRTKITDFIAHLL